MAATTTDRRYSSESSKTSLESATFLGSEHDSDRESRTGLLAPGVTDVEALAGTEPSHPRPVKSQAETEYTVPTGKKLAYLGTYFLLNLSLTIYNKAVLGRFSYPWLLTALHATSASIGCFALLLRGHFTLTKLSSRENMILAMFSFLFTLNVAMSNISLNMVSVPFHQIMRSTCPVATIMLYRTVYGRTYSTATYLSMIPLIFGVGLATYGDYEFTTLGFVATLVGVILAAVKTIVTNRLLTGSLKLPALELLLRMSPLAAFQSLLCALLKGEISSFATATMSGHVTAFTAVALLGNGLLAFLLNVSSFQTNKLAGALTISVCGNVKQCLTILVGIVLFDVRVGALNGLGMLVALVGAGWYSKVELDSRGKAAAAAVAQSTPLPDRVLPTTQPPRSANEWDEKQVATKKTDT